MKKFRFFTRLLPDIIGVVNTIETLSSGKPKIGLQKANLALEMIRAGTNIVGDIDDQQWQEVLPGVEKTINAYVAFANSVGLFKKSPQ